MKRVCSETKLQYSLQVKFDSSVVLNPEKLAIFQKNESEIKLRDFVSLLGSNITRDELVYLHSQLSEELGKRTAIVSEMIPDDVWKRVFQLLAHNKDISKVFHLKQVCKRWERSFPSALDEATIRHQDSLEKILDLKSIRSLIIRADVEITERIFASLFVNLNSLTLTNASVDSPKVSPEIVSQMTNLKVLNLLDTTDIVEGRELFINIDNLSLLVNLESLKIEEMSSDPFKSLTKLVNLKNLDISALPFDSARELKRQLGVNLEAIGQLKKLELITLSDPEDFPVKINELQQQYPRVKFRWFYEDEGDQRYYYEGSFCDNNLMSGKGVSTFVSTGGIYEGEFKCDMKSGKGVYYDPSFRYEGEFKDDDMDGKGVYYWLDGGRYEGDFKKGISEGRGVLYWADGDRFEGEFENDIAKLGIVYYTNGNRYSGDFHDTYREGKGTMLYSNGNRYEGVYVNNERAGNGVFYYSNGERVEGDESVFYLNEDDGTIEMV